MKKRIIGQSIMSSATQDGAGVKMRRIFWREDTLNIDPFLMLDTFDSHNPDDYTRGFPMHPHRGIETFTYLINGEIKHTDSLGNKGFIRQGEYQWMTAGNGILHEEMPQASSSMQGFQLWVNLPQKHKMTSPDYVEGNKDTIPVVEKDEYTVKVLAGEFEGKKKGEMPGYIEIEVFDIEIQPNKTIQIPINTQHNAFLEMFSGTGSIGEKAVEEKAAVTLVDGDTVEITAGDKGARIYYFAGPPLNEPIAWGGSIVMNTQEELQVAYQELSDGTFIK